MKIAFFTPNAETFNPLEGGVGRIINILKEKLESLSYEIFLITNKSNGEISPFVYYLPHEKIDSSENKYHLKQIIHNNGIQIIVNEIAYSEECINLFSSVNDVVKIVNVHNNCIECLVDHYDTIFRNSKPGYLVKTVDTFNLWSFVRFLFKIRSKSVWQKSIDSSDAFVIYFESFNKEFKTIYGIESSKIKIITNPSTYDKIESVPIEKTLKKIIYVGRVEIVQKRVDKLLNLWHRLHDSFTDWEFDLIGYGSYLEDVKAYLEKNELNRINILGKKDPFKYWKEADIFTLTSDFEGFGLVLIEAQSCGTVPITFKCFSAVNEVVSHNKSGIIIEDFNEELMFEEVSKLMKDEERLKELKMNGFEHAKKFNQDKIVNEWIKLFEDLMIVPQ
jgi:glycosyltransferase involved in cell wall biosynthesis